MRFPLLFSPIDVGGMFLKNRIVMAPMATRYATCGGMVTDRMIRYYAERARGGVGLIMVQFTAVAPNGRSSLWPLGIWDDRFVPGLRRLADTIHDAGAKAGIQIAHAGGQTRSEFIDGEQPVAPSPIPRLKGEVPRELTKAEITGLVEAFGQAARRAEEAGFDAVEVHMAHGYLINQFLSPLSNRRTDEYGGDLEGRVRFALEILQRVRQITKRKTAILCRISAEEYVAGGLTLADSQSIAQVLEQSGVHAIHVSAGIGQTMQYASPSMALPAGALVPLAAGIKCVVRVPIIAVGKIHTPGLAEEILGQGKADLIAMGRALIADPELPSKAESGRIEKIRPCLTCNQPACQGRIFSQLDMSCVVNPAVGREADMAIMPAPRRKRVVVVGAGPAGLEAACVAAERGHSVIVYEKEPEPGGQFRIAQAAPYKELLGAFIRYQVRRLKRFSAELRTGRAIDITDLDEEHLDVVILATGARPLVPDIPGAREHAVTAWAVLEGRVEVGDNVVVVGGGEVGCATGEYLAQQGKSVTILEMLDKLVGDVASWIRIPMIERIVQAGVEILTNARVMAIDPRAVLYERVGVKNWIRNVDTVVLAVGTIANSELGEALRNAPYDVRMIGDCVRPQTALEAIREGLEIGATI